MIRARIPERGLMHMRGHKTCAAFDRYHVVINADLNEAAKRLLSHLATFFAKVTVSSPKENLI